MTRMHHPLLGSLRLRSARTFVLVCLTLSSLLSISVSATAQLIDGMFYVGVGESERLLAAQIELDRNLITQMQFNSIVFQESCMNPSTRLHLRNRFAISIQNAPTSQGDLTSVTIDLTSLIPATVDPAFVFGNGDIPTDGFNGNFLKNTIYFDDGDGINDDGNPVTVTAIPFQDPNDRTQITFNFNGLTPGKAIIFRLDLDNNPDNGAFTDYRHPIFGLNVGGTGTTTPAEFSATFTADLGQGPVTEDTPFTPFIHDLTPDELAALAIAPQIEPYHTQTPSRMFGQTGRTIPEPSTAMLLFAGLGLLGGTRRKRCC